MQAEGETVAKRKFNTRQFIDAMKKNGYRKSHGHWVQFMGSKPENGVYAACAGGQALLNLGVAPADVETAHYYLPAGFQGEFIGKNDNTKSSVTQIAEGLMSTSWYTDPIDFELPF